MKPEDIKRMHPDDRFHVTGFRIRILRDDWPRGLRWLQRLIERWHPPIPAGSIFTMTVNGRPMMKAPLPLMTEALATVGSKSLALSPTDEFQVAVTFPKGIRILRRPLSVMVDGYLVRGRDSIADTIYVEK